jgi:hypothetical protein
MEILNGYLYVSTTNPNTGMEVWRSDTGSSGDWDQIGFAGFGDSNNPYAYYDNAMAVFNNRLFTGAWNWANGGEVWQLAAGGQVYLPIILKNYP